MSVMVAIPVRDNLALTESIVGQLRRCGGWDDLLVIDNGSADGTSEWLHEQDDICWRWWPKLTITQMWNKAWSMAEARHHDYLALLNNDITIGPDFLQVLTLVIESDPKIGIAYPGGTEPGPAQQNYVMHYTSGTKRHGGMTGHAFMVRVALRKIIGPIDEQFVLWCGDDDLAFSTERAGYKQARVVGLGCAHQNEATVALHPELEIVKGEDVARFRAKWGNR